MTPERFARTVHLHKGCPTYPGQTPPRKVILAILTRVADGLPVVSAKGWECEVAARYYRHLQVPFAVGWSPTASAFVITRATEKQVDGLAGIP